MSKTKKNINASSKKKQKNSNVLFDSKITTLRKKLEQTKQAMHQKDEELISYKKQLLRMNQLVQKMIEKMDGDMEKLHRLHDRLVPDQFPSINNCQFSFKFKPAIKGEGKDFYQVVPIKGKKMHFGIILSSCSSFGISSLLFSSRAKMMSQMDIKNANPADFLKNLSKEVHYEKEFESKKNEVDIFYAVMSRKTFKLSYCCVGLVNAFFYTHSKKSVTELSPTSSFFDINSSSHFVNKKISLNPRDQLIICSPGVALSKNKKGELFGKKELTRIIKENKTLGAHRLRNKIIYALKNHNKDTTIHRDQSVFVLEITDKILKLA